MLEKILPLLRDVLSEVNMISRTFRFGSSRQHLIAGALFGRVLEEIEGIYATLERRDGACGFILLRSLLEAYVDLSNIAKDSGYADYMRAGLLDQDRKLLEGVLKRGSTSPVLVDLAKEPGAEPGLKAVLSELEELRQRGVSPLQVRRRFELANELGQYEGPYSELCRHSHNNFSVLERRHLRLVNGFYEIRVFDPITESDAQLISDTSAGVAANTIVAVGNMLNSEHPLDLVSLTGKLDKLRELWKQHAGGDTPSSRSPVDG